MLKRIVIYLLMLAATFLVFFGLGMLTAVILVTHGL